MIQFVISVFTINLISKTLNLVSVFCYTSLNDRLISAMISLVLNLKKVEGKYCEKII